MRMLTVSRGALMESSSGGRSSRQSQPHLGGGSRSPGGSRHLCDEDAGNDGDSNRRCD